MPCFFVLWLFLRRGRPPRASVTVSVTRDAAAGTGLHDVEVLLYDGFTTPSLYYSLVICFTGWAVQAESFAGRAAACAARTAARLASSASPSARSAAIFASSASPVSTFFGAVGSSP